jgi:hypothetical protein
MMAEGYIYAALAVGALLALIGFLACIAKH